MGGLLDVLMNYSVREIFMFVEIIGQNTSYLPLISQNFLHFNLTKKRQLRRLRSNESLPLLMLTVKALKDKSSSFPTRL